MNRDETALEFDFGGAWLPDVDPLKIGKDNFALLENYRPTDRGIERVQGYSEINATALTTYIKLRSGIQLNTPHTDRSLVLVQAYNTGLTASKIYQNKGAIPAASDFEATELHTDASGAGLGRFSRYPDFTAAYCNEQEACIWAGTETRIGAFLTVTAITDLAVTNPIDFTVELTNTLQSTGNVLAFTTKKALIASTRPLKGIKFYVKTANGTASTSTVKYWNGSAWAAVANFSDGTRPGTISLAQTGTMAFDSTVDVAKVAYIEGMSLYFYLVELSAGSATLYHVTNDAPFQPILDIWDGIYRTCITLQASRSSVYEDYTIEINTASNQAYPIQALLGGLTSSDFVIGIFEERMTALSITMIAGMTNTTAATVTIYYWSGTAWVSVGTVTDGTLASGASMNQSGVMSWNAPAETSEKAQTLFGVSGYAYKIKWSATLTDRARASAGTHTGANGAATLTDITKWWEKDEWVGSVIHNTTDGSSVTVTANTPTTVTGTLAGGTDNDWDTNDTYIIDPWEENHDGTSLDMLSGIPAQKTVRPFRFPFMFQNRPMLCGDIVGKQGNRVDYGMANTTQVFNGEFSSRGGSELYFGAGGQLTAAAEIYNRFGSNILDTGLFFFPTSTYLLYGTDPSDYRIFQISMNYGCPAPRTIVTAEVGFEVGPETLRNIAIWISHKGPIVFDAAVIMPIPGFEIYFDPRKSSCIDFDAIEDSIAWLESDKMEYNFIIPLATGGHAWLVYNLKLRKAFKINTNTAEYPKMVVPIEDLYGKKYVYAGIDTGNLERLENGTTWDGTTIQHKVKTADVLPFGDVWNRSRINQFKFLMQIPDFEDQALTASITISVNHYKDGQTDAEALQDIVIAKSDYMEEMALTDEDGNYLTDENGNTLFGDIFRKSRYARKTQAVSLLAYSHQFEFTIDSDAYSYLSDFGKSFLGWSLIANLEKQDLT